MNDVRSIAVRGARSAMRRARARLPHRRRPAILTYHRFGTEQFDPWGLAVTPDNFRDQIRWLSKSRKVLRLSEFVDLQQANRLPEGAVAITMDDGYASTMEIAAPVLEQYAAPATIFLPAALIGEGQPFWWDELKRLVLMHRHSTVSLDGDLIAIGERSPNDWSWQPGRPPRTQRQEAFLRIHGLLMRKNRADLEIAMQGLRAQADGPGAPDRLELPITERQLREAPEVIEFGSHTLTHAWLPGLTAGEKREEVGASVEACCNLTHARPTTFAYPFGAFDDQSQKLAEQAGFECACTTEEFAVSPQSGRFSLPRITVGNWDHARLRRALADIRCAEESPAL